MVNAGRPACGTAGGKTLLPFYTGARQIIPDVKRAEMPVKRPGVWFAVSGCRLKRPARTGAVFV